MVDKLITPTCEVSGLPLPVLPLEPRLFGALLNLNHTNSHHHFHPKSDPRLQSVAGLALRKSRIQTTPLISHNEYHRLYEGAPLPDTEEQIFKLSVLSVAGFTPRSAIDPRQPLRIVGLTDKAHSKIARSIRVERPLLVARFYAEYCASQETDYSKLEELLHQSTTDVKKVEIAREVLGYSIESALGRMSLSEPQIRKEGFISGSKAKTLYSATRQLIRRHALRDYVDHLSLRYAKS